ncbi:tyrosine-type recombinase/integrase [Burkholderia ambifaria]|nr:tyrosine-type recombinase/integrase [Burkholderia ambifaria]
MAELTVKKLQAQTPSDAGARLTDGQSLYGLVRVTSKGHVTVLFRWRFRHDGKTHDFNAGTWPKESLAKIRQNRDAAAQLIAGGVNPNDAKKERKLTAAVEKKQAIHKLTEQLARPTLRSLFDEWERDALSQRKDNGAETRRAFEKDIFPKLGDLFAIEIKRVQLLAALKAIVHRGAPRLANRTLSDLKQLFKWAMLREYVQIDPLMAVTKRDVGGADHESDRTLSDDEIKALPAALQSSGLPDVTIHALLLILGTGVRVGEVIRAKREHFDLTKRQWIIPRENSKNGEAHRIFLSDFSMGHARHLLDASSSDIWLLPSPMHTSDVPETHVGLKSITKQVSDRQLKFFARSAHPKRTVRHANALVLANDALSSWSPHDLRRTCATIMASLTVLPHVIDRCLNHVEENRVRRTYQRHDYAREMERAWTLLGKRLQHLTNATGSNVVAFRAANA